MPSHPHVITKPEIYVDGKPRPLLRWEIGPLQVASLGSWQRLSFTYLDDAGQERTITGRLSCEAEERISFGLV